MSETNQPQQPVLVYPQYPMQQEDEINLFDLWRQLVARKNLILIITALFAIVSIIAVLTMPKTWQAEIQFMPPKLENIQRLNIEGLKTTQYTPGLVFGKFLVSYQSIAKKRKFFNERNMLDDYNSEQDEDKTKRAAQVEKAFRVFNQSLTINIPKGKLGVAPVKSTLDFPKQQLSSEYLNQYAQIIKVDVLNNILDEIESQIIQQQTFIKEQIMSKTKIAKHNREDRVAVLNEAIKTAKLLNIKEGELQFIKGNTTNSPINKETSLYYRGYESLEVERRVLEERKNDIPFIDGFRELEEKSFQLDEKLERIQREKKNLSVVTIDQEALIPENPIKPKRKLIVIISTILGFILSLFLVFILNIKQKYQDEYASN